MQRSSWVVAVYALLALIVIPVFPHFSSPNEFARWLLVASVVENHTIEVSRLTPPLGPTFEDLAVVDGRVYSNKAPGLALVAAPGYLLARPFIGPPSRENLRPALTAMRWTAATLPLLLMALLFARVAAERGAESSAFATATLLFGTPLFAYGLLLFSHALVAACLFAAWVGLYLRDRGGVAAGALIGLAVLAEYPVAIAAGMLVGGLVVTRQWKRLMLTLAGGAPFALVLALYQKAAFGGVFVGPYRFEKVEAYRRLGATGLGGVNILSPRIIFDTLLHPARGLLVFAPVLIAALAALPHARRALPRPAFVTMLLAPAGILLVYGGYPNWHGGWNVGPRYVVAMLPFLVFPLAFIRIRAWMAVLFGASACAVMLTTLVYPFVPLDFPLPWGSLSMPLLAHGLVTPNLLHLIAPWLAVALPFAAILAAVIVAMPRRLLLAGVAGIVLALVAGYAAMRYVAHFPRPYIERVMFEEIDFGRSGELDALVRARVAAPWLRQRRDAMRLYGPTEWPFTATP